MRQANDITQALKDAISTVIAHSNMAGAVTEYYHSTLGNLPKHTGCGFYLRQLRADTYDKVAFLKAEIEGSDYTRQSYEYNVTNYCSILLVDPRVLADLNILNGSDGANSGYSLGITNSSVSALCEDFFYNYGDAEATAAINDAFDASYISGC